jgi:asparagine synthase (glutamine-hydrolysing)
MEPQLPREILYRDKMGFAVPLARWFRGPLRQSARTRLLEGNLKDADFFDMHAIARVLDDHTSGVRDYSAAIWALLMFESFLRNVHAGSSPGRVDARRTA